jgi:serine protease Do
MKKINLVLSALTLAALFTAFSLTSVDVTVTPTPVAQAQKTIAPQLKFGDALPANAFVELAKMINPAVVNISTSTMPKIPGGGRGFRGRDPLLDMLQDMYGLRMGPGGGGQQAVRPMQALGTGFIIRDDGLIVTNNHVIAGADKIQVQLSEKDKMYDAKLIGSDERTDIALIKIVTKEKLPTAQMGSSKELEVGEWVAAFGNPLGQGHTMTKGIISAKGREIGEINKFPLIQTDTPINPGNSGGPLVNMRGQVIGVNSAIAASAQGIGFAIPIDDVKAILPILEKEGGIKRGYLGLGLDDLNPQAAQYLGLKDTEGALVAGVDPKGNAAKGGIQPYDVITEFNGRKINNMQNLMDAVGDGPIGSTAKVKLIREGKQKTVDVQIGERPGQNTAVKKTLEKKEFIGQSAPDEMGFSVADMTDEIKREFKVDPDTGKRPVIVSVEPNSKADEVGLMPGDVILEVNRKPVTSSKEALNNLKKGQNTLRVSRGGATAIIMF